MVRQQIQLNLPGPQITPAAQPVDIFYRTNVPKPKDLVATTEGQSAEVLAALSPTLQGFLQWREKGLREFDEVEAQQAVSQMTADQFEAFKKQLDSGAKMEWSQFGKSGSRPIFQLAMQYQAGTRTAREAQDDVLTRFRELESTFKDPSRSDVDIDTALRELRQEFQDTFGDTGYYYQQGVSSVLDPLFERLSTQAVTSRQESFEAQQVSDLQAAASAMFGAFAAGGDYSQAVKDFKSKNLTVVGMSPQQTREIYVDALLRAAMDEVESDPREGLERALELLARAELEGADGISPDGKVLVVPGTSLYDKIIDGRLRLDARAEQLLQKTAIDETELLNDYIAEFLLQDGADPQEAEARLKADLLSMGQTEFETSSALLNFREKIEAESRKTAPDLLRDLNLGVEIGKVSVEELDTHLRSGALNLEDWRYLRGRAEELTGDFSLRMSQERAVELTRTAANRLLGFDITNLPAAERRAVEEIEDDFNREFADDIQQAGSDVAARSKVITEYSSGSKFKAYKERVDSLNLGVQRLDLSSYEIRNRNAVVREAAVQAKVFEDSVADVVPVSPESMLDLLSFLQERQDDVVSSAVDQAKEDGVLDVKQLEEIARSALVDARDRLMDEYEQRARNLYEASIPSTERQDLAGGVSVDSSGKMPTGPSEFGFADIGPSGKLGADFLTPGGDRKSRTDVGDFLDMGFEWEQTGKPVSVLQDQIFRKYGFETIDRYRSEIAEALDGSKRRVRLNRISNAPAYYFEHDMAYMTRGGRVVPLEALPVYLTHLTVISGLSPEEALQKPLHSGFDKTVLNRLAVRLNSKERAEWDDELNAVLAAAGAGVPTEEQLRATRWGQVTENFGLPLLIDVPDQGRQVGPVEVMLNNHRLLGTRSQYMPGGNQ